MSRVVRGCKRDVLWKLVECKGLVGNVIYMGRKFGLVSEDIVEELEEAMKHILKAIDMVKEAEVVRNGKSG